MIRLNRSLKNQIGAKIRAYHQSLLSSPVSGERDFVKRTVNAFKSFRPAPSGGQSLSTRSANIDGKPIVDFMPFSGSLSPAFAFSTKKEIGDLLFVYKYFFNNKLVAHRASIVQAKYTRRMCKSWIIDTGQFYLMNYWPCFRIIKPKPRKFKIYYLEPKTRSWATYGFVGPNVTKFPVFFSSQLILSRYSMPKSKYFNFDLSSMPNIWVYTAGYLSKLLQDHIGENLLGNLEVTDLVNDLYKIVKLHRDPPGEFEWDNQESEEGKSFGIIEFKVVQEEENK
jgi:hypothetical protein